MSFVERAVFTKNRWTREKKLLYRGARSLNLSPVHKLQDMFGSHLIHGGARLCGLWWKKSITKSFTHEAASVPKSDISDVTAANYA
jgi:hypothetical protein